MKIKKILPRDKTEWMFFGMIIGAGIGLAGLLVLQVVA
jgi:hypothetical protein